MQTLKDLEDKREDLGARGVVSGSLNMEQTVTTALSRPAMQDMTRLFVDFAAHL